MQAEKMQAEKKIRKAIFKTTNKIECECFLLLFFQK